LRFSSRTICHQSGNLGLFLPIPREPVQIWSKLHTSSDFCYQSEYISNINAQKPLRMGAAFAFLERTLGKCFSWLVVARDWLGFLLDDWLGGGDGADGHDAFDGFFAQDLLAVELGHAGVFRVLLDLLRG
jgi:hypothetical protein